jgi:hypothetical protein
MNQNNQGGHSGAGAGGPSAPISTGRAGSGAGGNGGGGGGGGGARNTSVGGSSDTPGVRQLRYRRDVLNETLTPEETAQIDRANRRNETSRSRGPRQRAQGGPGGGGGAGGQSGDVDTSATVDTRGGSSSAEGGSNNQQTNNARYKTRDIGGDVTGMGTAGSVALATVPTAIVAALAAYGFSMMNGKVVDQRGQVVPPQNIPPQVQQLMSGGAKANQLALRTQANQMGDAQNAQKFIEDRRSNPKFKTAQDFYNDAVNQGLTPSMVNQVTALAKAIGYKDLTPYTN